MQIGNSQIAKEAIEKYSSIIIFHHIRPDGDCLGSQFGLAELIKTNYPDKNVYTVGDNKNVFDFMNYTFSNYSDINFTNSLAIVVDASSGDRIECSDLLYEDRTTAKLRIDHHPNGSDITYDYLWVDDSYVAAAEMIAMLAYESRWKVTNNASSQIYLGINTDSGRFLYPNTSARTYKLVSFIMSNGFTPKNILQQLNKRNLNDINYIGYILSNFKKTGRVLYFNVTQEIMDMFSMNSLKASLFVNELANIDDNRCWAFFIQLENGQIRGRLRSNGPLVNQIAKLYNGGGHDNAAGITLNSWDEIPEVISKLNNLIDEYEQRENTVS